VQIERSFLSSRVARRVFFLFILCALLPVGALSLVSFSDVTGQLTQQAERRVRQESKAMGMAVYQRLLLWKPNCSRSADSTMRSPRQRRVTSRRSRFRAHRGSRGWPASSGDGATSVFLGELQSIPTVSPAQWALLRQKKTLLTTATDDLGARRLFLVRLSDSDTSAVVAEINGDYLWDLAGSMTLPAEMSMCVFGPAPEVLFCSPSAPATLKVQRVGQGEGGSTSCWNGEMSRMPISQGIGRSRSATNFRRRPGPCC
jgi:hypothetical protein